MRDDTTIALRTISAACIDKEEAAATSIREIEVQRVICCYAHGAFHKVVWQVTDRCSLECPYCFTPSKGRPDPDLNNVYRTIDYLRSTFPEKNQLLFAGREPLLFPDLESAVSRATDNGFHCSVSSSGELLSGDWPYRLRDCGAKKVNLTLNSIIPMIHDATRPGGNVRSVIEGIRKSLLVGLDVKVNVTLTRFTLHSLTRTLIALMDMSVRNIAVGVVHRDASYLMPELLAYFSRAQNILNTHDMSKTSSTRTHMRIVIPPIHHECYKDMRCPGRRGLVAVLPDGSITSCNIYPKWHGRGGSSNE